MTTASRRFVTRWLIAASWMVATLSAPAPSQEVAPALQLPRLFGDGMVIQRDVALPVWGRAAPGDTILVRFGGATARATASADGAWRVELPATPAGEVHQLIVSDGTRTIVVRDVLAGDVWVASGQSNMELPLSRSNDAARVIASAPDSSLREFKVPTAWSWTAAEDVPGGTWSPADSAHAGAFSGVAYYFAKELRSAVGVPIGIVNTTWGGSNIETWMSREALGLSDSAYAALQEADRAWRAAIRASLRAIIGDLPSVDSGLVAGRAVWASPSFDDRAWRMIEVPGMWEQRGYPGLDGVAWYRVAFTLTSAEARRAVRLGLGAIDDDDITWVNGREVGRTSYYAARRVYTVPASALRAGRNVVAIRVSDGGGGGGLTGPVSDLFLEVAGSRRPLGGAWKFKVAQVSLRDDGQRVNKIPAALYNAMLHPLLSFPVKGVIWYQGESNANNDEQAIAYREQFVTLIESWRRAWARDGRALPFLWVQLANFGAPDRRPPELAAWALLRDAQTATLSLPATGQAVTIDIGDPFDIHPRNKQDVGRRLALQALRVAYDRSADASGPTYAAHSIGGGRVTVAFDHADDGLVSRAGDDVAGFAIAGEDRRFVWANARIEGARVVAWSDSVREPVAVRYAWGNSPSAAGLYNRAGLPAVPFRTDAWVGTWMAAVQLTEPRNLPPAPGLGDNTLRQIIQTTIGGRRIRLRFSNDFGNAPLTIRRARIARATVAGTIDTLSDVTVSFAGSDSLTIASGQRVWSDPLAFEVRALELLAITLHFGSTPSDVTGHPGSRTTSYLAAGDHAREAALTGAVPVEHWYVLTGVDVHTDASFGAVVALGNSITDGRGSGTNKQNRWTDNLARRLQSDVRTANVAVLNAGVGGNCVTRACLGPATMDRIDRDVLQQSGVRWVIVLHGINDIGTSRGEQGSKEAADRIVASYRRIIERAHAAGLRVYGATLLPFAGSGYYSPEHEAARQAVNQWIREGGFDAVIDLDAALRDPSNPLRLRPDADTGDHLHPNERGYEIIAAAIDLGLFRR